jgi:hypothetical protein
MFTASVLADAVVSHRTYTSTRSGKKDRDGGVIR